jgi:lysophospholipase L1-like esterase
MVKKLFLVCVSLIITLSAVELLLRVFWPIYPVAMSEAYEYDPQLGNRLRPDIHLFKVADFQEEIRVNSLGTVNFQDNFDGYKTLVFALGDSFTQGTGLPADMSYPAQLDLILNTNSDGFYEKHYGLVNLGVAAQGGEQEFLELQRWSQLIGKPSIILYQGCDNDYTEDLLFKNGWAHRAIVQGSPTWGRWVTPIRWLSQFQIGIRIRALTSRHRISNATKGEIPNKSVAELESPLLERLSGYARENRVRLIVTWSNPGASYDWLKDWANESNVTFADWVSRTQSIQSAIPAMPTENNHSGGHHRGWVNHVIAEEFGRQIR